jgi:cell division septation protein DedD
MEMRSNRRELRIGLWPFRQREKAEEIPIPSPLLGSSKGAGKESKTERAPVRSDTAPFVPQAGQTFLQLGATTRDEAEGVADVLQRKGFRAHAVPKPGNPKLYRILIGPLRDAGDLSNTREALRNRAGFRVMIVQRY